MIYELLSPTDPISQGDILRDCPLVYWEMHSDGEPTSVASRERVFVLTQSCDLENSKTSKVQVAVIHDVETLVNDGILKPQMVRDQEANQRGAAQFESMSCVSFVSTSLKNMHPE